MKHTSALRADIDACGYFPDLVEDTVLLGLGSEEMLGHVVHHEATFALDAVQRHITVLVATPRRLLIVHTDETNEHVGEVPNAAVTTVESIPLHHINVVALTRVVANPAAFAAMPPKPVVETWLSVGWGTLRRIDLEPATCSDPTCQADHGLSGNVTSDDLTVRMSAAADGVENVTKLVAFAALLQQLTGSAG